MPSNPGTYATFKTSEGTIVCELFEKDAPETVANFIGLAEGTKEWNSRSKKGNKLYDGTIFHRVIPQFMIQGGDPEGTGMGGPGYKFADETKGSRHSFNAKGKLAMANAGPNTNGSQFFITVADTSWLTGKHTIFGEVVEGYDVVEKISKLSRDGMDRPKTPVTIESRHHRAHRSLELTAALAPAFIRFFTQPTALRSTHQKACHPAGLLLLLKKPYRRPHLTAACRNNAVG